MKKFLKSKKALIAAALAALLAMSGVTYAWFTWSTGVTGGSLKMDYVQIDAEYGVFLKEYQLGDLILGFENYWRGHSGHYGEASVPILNLEDNNASGLFFSFEFLKSSAADVKEYLESHYFNGYLSVLSTTLSSIYYSDYFGQFGADFYDWMIDPAEAANVKAALYAACEHLLPSETLQVGFQIRNLGAGCWIKLPDLMNDVLVNDGTLESAHYNEAQIVAAWQLGEYGNPVFGNDGWIADLGGHAFNIGEINGLYGDAAAASYTVANAANWKNFWATKALSDVMIYDGSDDWKIVIVPEAFDIAALEAPPVDPADFAAVLTAMKFGAAFEVANVDNFWDAVTEALNVITGGDIGAFWFSDSTLLSGDELLAWQIIDDMFTPGSIFGDKDMLVAPYTADTLDEIHVWYDPATETTLLHMIGDNYVYGKDDAIVNFKFDVNFGKYLDNRFETAVLDFQDTAAVAVQDTIEAAIEAFGLDASFKYTCENPAYRLPIGAFDVLTILP